MPAPQSVKKLIFDRLAEGKEAPKTNKSNSSAYKGTVEFDLCSKSKHLAKQGFLRVLSHPTPHPSKISDFCHLLLKEKAFFGFCVLTVWGFFDTLRTRCFPAARPFFILSRFSGRSQ